MGRSVLFFNVIFFFAFNAFSQISNLPSQKSFILAKQKILDAIKKDQNPDITDFGFVVDMIQDIKRDSIISTCEFILKNFESDEKIKFWSYYDLYDDHNIFHQFYLLGESEKGNIYVAKFNYNTGEKKLLGTLKTDDFITLSTILMTEFDSNVGENYLAYMIFDANGNSDTRFARYNTHTVLGIFLMMEMALFKD